MKLEQGEISCSQLIFLIGGYMQGGLLSSFSDPISKHDTWLAVLAALFLGLLFSLVYSALAMKFPGKNLIQIIDLIYGPYLGMFISFQYILLFITALSTYLWFIGDFVLTYIMPETPILLIMIMFTFVCAWAVRQGIEIIARISIICVFTTSSIALITFVLLLKDMDFTNFLPFFEVSLGDFIQSTHIIMHVSFSEVVIFLMVIPYLNKPTQTRKSVLIGLLLGGLTLFFVSIRNIAVLGPLSSIVTSPSMEAVRLINLAKIISRLEILVAMVHIFLLFIIASVLYYVTVLSVAQISKLRSCKPIVLPIGIIGITLAFISFDSRMELTYSTMYISPIVSVWFYIIIPLISLLVAKLRKFPKQLKGSHDK